MLKTYIDGKQDGDEITVYLATASAEEGCGCGSENLHFAVRKEDNMTITYDLRDALKTLRDVIQEEHPHAVKAVVSFERGIVQIKVDEHIVCTNLENNP